MANIINFDKYVKNESKAKNWNNETLQNFSRTIIYGMTGSGKTNLLLNLIFNNKGGCQMYYDRVYLYAKNLEQPKYVMMQKRFEKIEAKVSKKVGIEFKMFFTANKLEDVLPVDAMDPDYSNICIFDDFITEKNLKKSCIVDYWIRSRHKHCSCIFLSQSFTTIPKDIRINTDYLILFRVNNKKELDRIYADTVRGITKEDFIRIFNNVISKDPYGFITVDNLTMDPERKVRAYLL
jgi:energy-coupling factor transporter ATP-binding protein EcfA2